MIGQEWTWTYSYPRLGVQSHVLELPVGRPVQFRVTSDDVLHGFGLAALGIAMDANPGEWVATPVVKPNRLGTYEARCIELCGLYHTYMWSQVKVVPQSTFAGWVKANGGNSAVLSSPTRRDAEGTTNRQRSGRSHLMSATAAAPDAAAAPPARSRGKFVPSIVSGLVLGLVAAIVVGVIVHSLVSGSRQADDTMVSAYLAWFIFFLIGVGAAELPRLLGARPPGQDARGGAAGGRQGRRRLALLPLLHRPQGRRHPVPRRRCWCCSWSAAWRRG